jgi:hypothetical protein
MITSCGQSPDALIVKVLCGREKIKVAYEPALKPENLKDVGSLLIVLGASAKGLGEAGINESQEMERASAILDEAKKQGLGIIGIHVGGESRRGALSSKFIELAAPRTDMLIVTSDGNKDGRFTEISEENGIPLVVVEKTVEVGKELKRIYGMN